MVTRLQGILDVRLVGVAVATMCTVFYGAAVAQSGDPYAVVASVIDGGGTTTAAGGTMSLSVSVGQPDAELLSGGSYAVDAGFLGAALSEAPPCVGDCHGNGQVTVDEILTLVNIALGTTDVATCEAGDPNHDGQITVDEILAAVNNALNGCGGG